MSIPIPTVKRLPSYLRILNQRKEMGEEYISATHLAEELGLKPIQVRKDLSLTGIEGKPKVGFDIEELISSIIHTLGWDNTTDALIVGAGNLGSALACYDGFSTYGLRIVAIFDKDPGKVGGKIGSMTVLPMEKLNSYIAEQNYVASKLIETGDYEKGRVLALKSDNTRSNDIAKELILLSAGLSSALSKMYRIMSRKS